MCLSVLWIRIRFGFGRLDPDLDPGGQKSPTKVNKFQVLNENFS
jgi:hypothetical protein